MGRLRSSLIRSLPVAGKPSKGAARATFREVVNESTTRERVQRLVDDIFEMKRLAWSTCPDCRKRVQVEIPDLRGQVTTLVELLEQAEGKPEGEVGGVSIVVKRLQR